MTFAMCHFEIVYPDKKRRKELKTKAKEQEDAKLNAILYKKPKRK